MADVTVEQFAEVLKVPVEKLLSQLDDAGIKVSGAEEMHQAKRVLWAAKRSILGVSTSG